MRRKSLLIGTMIVVPLTLAFVSAAAANSIVAPVAYVDETTAAEPIPDAVVQRYYGTTDAEVRQPFSLIALRLQSQGYADIKAISYDSGSFSVQARDKNGRLVRLVIDAATGKITRQRIVDSFESA